MTVREKIILDAEDRASAKFDQASKSFGGLSKSLKSLAIGGGLAIAGAKMAGFVKDVAEAGIAGAEAASAFDKTFGPAVGRMGDFVEEFANKAGFTTDTLQQMLAVTGNIVQGLGGTEEASARLSERMARLSADVASFSNAQGGATAVLQALQSAISGQRMALKTYGLAIDETEVQQQALLETGKQSVDELTRLDKAAATVTLAYQKAGKAVGDLDRTQDSAANTARRIKAEWGELKGTLGAELLPAIQTLLPVLEQAIEAAGPGLTSAFRHSTTAILFFEAAWQDTMALIKGFGTLTEGARQAAERRTVLEMQMQLNEGMFAGQDAATRLANAMAELGKRGYVPTAEKIAALNMFIGANHDETQAAIRATRDWASTQEGFMPTVQEMNRQIESQTTATQAVDGWMIKWTDDLHDAETATAGAASKADNYALTQDQVAIALWKAQQAQRNFSKAVLAAADPVFGAIDAYSRYQETLAKVNEDGQVTADEQIDITRATWEMTAAFAALDDSDVEAAITALSGALAVTRDEARNVLNELGLIDGMQISADIELNLIGTGPDFIPEGSSAGGTVTRDPFAGNNRGIVGFAAGGISTQDQLAFLHRNEIVINPADNGGAAISQLADLIVRAITETGNRTFQIEVNNPVGEPTAESVEAALTSSALLEAIA